MKKANLEKKVVKAKSEPTIENVKDNKEIKAPKIKKANPKIKEKKEEIKAKPEAKVIKKKVVRKVMVAAFEEVKVNEIVSFIELTFQLNYHTEAGESVWITNKEGFFGDSLVKLMEYEDSEHWKMTILIDPKKVPDIFEYQYHVKKNDGSFLDDFKPKQVALKSFESKRIFIRDFWDYAGYYGHTFESAPFKTLFALEQKGTLKGKKDPHFTHLFQVKAPIIQPNEAIGIIGNIVQFGSWEEAKFTPLNYDVEKKYWFAPIALDKADSQIFYKYVIYDIATGDIQKIEDGESRYTFNYEDISVVQNDGFIHLPTEDWKGAGVNIPLFSIRSESDFGIGDFAGLEKFILWSKSVGLKLIQLLPINDTTKEGFWQDSYPYSAISVFALHPIYIDIPSLLGKSAKSKAFLAKIEEERSALQALAKLDYEAVFDLKKKCLDFIFPTKKKTTFASVAFKEFYEKNKSWLKPYALFSALRDKNESIYFDTWEGANVYSDSLFEKKYIELQNEIDYYVFIQFHLHIQLSQAVLLAKSNGIVLKGDIPIGVDRYSVDVWQNPSLYITSAQAGAPPDFFTKIGQNWGFPLYDWDEMAKDNYAWWRERLTQMSQYFEAIRLDHILGFFRIWGIPEKHTQGLLGYFHPANGFTVQELNQWGLNLNYERLCTPYITDEILENIFGDQTEYIKITYLDPLNDHKYAFKAAFDGQKKLVHQFKNFEVNAHNQWLLDSLLSLYTNVILIPDQEQEGIYHCRFHLYESSSYAALSDVEKEQYYHLHNHYFFERQETLWKSLGMERLPILKEASDMLVCGEDLGMIPTIVPFVLKNLAILGLKVERMPTNPQDEFESPKKVSYLNVVTPSTHDTAPLRNWYNGLDTAVKNRYYLDELHLSGHTAKTCSPILAEQIVLEHLQSPAIWSIFIIQDLLALEEELSNPDLEADYINKPEVASFYWQYRMHLNIETLEKHTDYTKKLQNLLQFCGR